MGDESFQERSEPATAKQLRESRDRGQVARSQEVNTVATLIAAFAYLTFAGPGILDRMVAMVRGCLSLADNSFPINPTILRSLFTNVIAEITMVVLPFALVLAATGVAACVGQFGFLFTLKPLEPKLSSLNPIKGVKKLFGVRGMVEALKAMIKFTIVAIFLYTFIRGLGPQLLALTHLPLQSIPGEVGGLVLAIVWRIIAALVLLAAADLIYQRYDYAKSLRMSKQDVKDERKQSEGDEKTRSRIRAKQMKITRNRMLSAVPTANVVITNPVHVAVALRYDPQTMAAPEVVAKGARLLAERIKSIARQHGVPIIERPPLARLLFKTVQVGRVIPESLYQVVAEVLAHVFRTRAPRRPPVSAPPPPPPPVPVA